ncbi:uncharacterized protein BP01DRAFT_45469 [Aspergillus saccharolyticus JOP 1030-1]|uniref:Uncharacterized protein n=1 Tax=Aspergillus saccharolyticus JOP 1030-1 TaxID=1450539 RepID=A0A318ZKX1_9EURO|nr:hypothetical protein BP01DRAFT_45469 [Aspergillus saccharolyticus JOP 1030-1]PYH45203.1 hypothetical protein BP01DRAFT_45469 [Aspergillus saccharolyticus JOP 1030-1]
MSSPTMTCRPEYETGSIDSEIDKGCSLCLHASQDDEKRLCYMPNLNLAPSKVSRVMQVGSWKASRDPLLRYSIDYIVLCSMGCSQHKHITVNFFSENPIKGGLTIDLVCSSVGRIQPRVPLSSDTSPDTRMDTYTPHHRPLSTKLDGGRMIPTRGCWDSNAPLGDRRSI